MTVLHTSILFGYKTKFVISNSYVFDESIAVFKVLSGMDALGVPVGTLDYRIAGVLRKSAQTRREWALAKSHVSSAQTRFNVLHHCLRTTFTHLMRALGPAVLALS